MEHFFPSAEQRSFEDSQVVGAHNFNADIIHHSYTPTEETTDEDSKSSAGFQLPFGSPWPFDNLVAFGDIPLADVKVSVVSPSIPQQPAHSAVKKKKSIFSLSSLYDPSGKAHHQNPGYLKAIEATLRLAAAIFSLVTFCVMTATRETRVAAGSTFEVKFSDFQAYNFLVALNILAFAYSSAQVVVIAQSSGGSIFSSPIKSEMFKYFCDEILAICLFSASSSAATASELSVHGLQNIWPPACTTWKLWMFCSKADVAIVISFFSAFSVILSSLFSGFSLLRLVALA